MSNKPIIEYIYREWWDKGPIVTTSKQQQEDLKLAFHVGWFAAMGMVGKVQLLGSDVAVKTMKQMQEECRKVLYNRTVMPKVVASINGEKLN